MKKLLFILTLFFVSLLTHATTGYYTSAQVATLKTDLTAGTYDIYELTSTGTYAIAAGGSSTYFTIGGSKTNVIIRAQAGLASKPILKMTTTSTGTTGSMFTTAIAGLTLTFSGIEFDGANTGSSGQPMLLQATGATNNIYVSNCNIHDFLNVSGNGAIRIDGTATLLDIQGSTINNCGGRVLFQNSAGSSGSVNLKNNTISNCTALLNTNRCNMIYWAALTSGTTTIDHCTFYNDCNSGGGISATDAIIRTVSGSGAITVTNTLFSNVVGNLPTAATENYCFLDGLLYTLSGTKPTGTNTFVAATPPSYTNTSTRDFTLTNRSSFVGSDGFTAGNSSIYPALVALTAPTVGTGSGQTSSGFTANWTKVTNAISYDVAVYQGASLISTTNASGQATQSLAITGLASNTTYTYTVTAKGDGISYSPSPASSPSAGVLTLGLTAPTVGTASSVSASGFTANWTAVSNAIGYDVQLYLGTQLVSTTNVSGQSTSSLAITGLSAGTTYTYKVVAKGNGSTYIDSTPSVASTSFTTSAVSVATINTNFADGTWGSIIPSPTTNLPASGSYPTSSINGFSLTKGLMYGGTSTGLQGEYHVNQIRLDKGTLGAMVTLPTVNSISQLEIHVAGTSPKQFVVRQYNTGTSAWDITVGTYTLSGAEDIFYIPVSGSNVQLRIENEATSTSTLQIYQITTRTTNPTTVLGAPYQPNVATAITGSSFYASWTAVPNASGYLVRTYSTIGTLRNTFSVSGGATTSYTVTGIDTVRVGTYKVVAVGDYVTYTNSSISPASATYTITRLATPVVGVGSAATASGFTANWSTVVNASSYDVLVYQGASLISTTNASGQAATSVAITGLSEYTSYTYTVIAKGDGATYFDSYPSTASASISTLRNLPKVTTPTIGTASSVLATGFTANWTAVDNAVSYNVSVYQGVTFIKTVNASGQATASVAITGLTAGFAYTYKVVAVGDGSTYDDSVISDASAIVTTNKLTTPTIGTASAVTATGFTANWTAVANASSYSVILYYGSNAIDTKSATGQSTQSIDFTGLTSGFNYTYKVQAIGDGTTYANSNVSVASASVTTNKLSIPTIGTASTITATGFTANWTAVANAVSYDVKVYDSGANLISTTNATGQVTNSLAITGLSNFTIYNYKVTAIGDANYANSDISSVSANFITLDPAAVNSVTTNFGDISWGTALAAVPGTGAFGSSTVNGFTLTNSCLTVSNTKGPKGESHTNRISLDKINIGYITLPTLNSVKQIEIHATSGSAGNGFSLQEYVPSSNTWVAVGSSYVYEQASKTAGIDSLYIIPITRNVQTRFRIGNIASGALSIYQIITRTTNPALLARPVATAATAVTGSGFTAHWSSVSNATGYSIKEYNYGTLKNTITVSDPSATSYAVSGIDTAMVCTYKVQAIGDGDNNYSDSYLSLPLSSFSITRLGKPVVGSASAISESGFTANWTAVANAVSYDVSVYQSGTLISTTNASGQATQSLAITGLSPNTAYTYKVMAIGDGSSTFNSYISLSGSATTSNLFNVTSTINISSLTNLSSGSAITVSNAGTLNIDVPKTVNSLTVNAGGKLTLNSGITFNVNTLNLNSDATIGTGTFVDNGGTLTAGTTNVQQYLTSGRNWYISSPVSGATSNVFNAASNVLYSYDETNAAWPQISDNGTGLGVMTGYVANMATNGAVTFTGTLNTGAQQIGLTRHAGVTKEGFNLVGNPYPSYLNFESAMASTSTANVSSTMWFRTKNAATWVFDTYNAIGHIGTSNYNNFLVGVTANIPPMQAFWVRVNSGQTTGTLAVDNTMRSHIDQTEFTRFKAPATTVPILHLQVTNGTNSDEAIVLFSSNASNGYDAYDSEKMTNANDAIPEIYTLAGTEQLVINGLNSIQYDTEISLGFTTGQANTFTIKASQFSNFVSGTQIVLRDKVLNVEQDLTVANYSFTSDVTKNNTSRFAVLFKAPSVATGINSANNANVWISTNANNQLMINGAGSVAVYNAIGQRIAAKNMSSTTTVLETPLQSGVYFVTVSNAGKSVTQKVIIK